MASLSNQKLNLLQSIGRLIKAINDEVDWFLLYVREKDKNQKRLFYSIYLSKCEQLRRIAAEEEAMKYAR